MDSIFLYIKPFIITRLLGVRRLVGALLPSWDKTEGGTKAATSRRTPRRAVFLRSVNLFQGLLLPHILQLGGGLFLC
jgi:hypothetical protein